MKDIMTTTGTSNNQPPKEFIDYVFNLIEGIILKEEKFNKYKKWFKKYCIEVGVNYNHIETEIKDFIDLFEDEQTEKNTIFRKMLNKTGKNIFLTSEQIDDFYTKRRETLKKQKQFEQQQENILKAEIPQKVNDFVKKHKGEWNNFDWLYFKNKISAKYKNVTERRLTEIVEEKRQIFLQEQKDINNQQRRNDYNNAVRKNTTFAFEKFINKYKSGDFISLAKQNIEKIKKEIENKKQRKEQQKKEENQRKVDYDNRVRKITKPTFEKTINNFIEVINNFNFEMILVSGGILSELKKEINTTECVEIESFFIGKHQVTQKLWASVMNESYNWWNKGDNRPVDYVNWNDTQIFIMRLNEITGKNYRLPTEIEWEYAARGGNKSKGFKYAGSNNVKDVAWYDENSGDVTHDVGTKKSNELGIYDMSGNVTEWCEDLYYSYATSGHELWRIIRGGSFSDFSKICEVNYSDSIMASYGLHCGFRLCL